MDGNAGEIYTEITANIWDSCCKAGGGFTCRNVVIVFVSWVFACLDMASDWANYIHIKKTNSMPSTEQIDFSESSLGRNINFSDFTYS